jgi:hypothetical protein
VLVPAAVRRGENVNLICQYDLEGDTLYSMKWYKGKREFFRFTPKENPSLQIFPVPGIYVEVIFIFNLLSASCLNYVKSSPSDRISMASFLSHERFVFADYCFCSGSLRCKMLIHN